MARLVLPLALMAALAGSAPAGAAIRIDVVSSRPDLVSGGNAVVTVAAKRAVARRLTIKLNRRNVTKRFKRRADGQR